MKSLPSLSFPASLGEKLWGNRPLGKRSHELTPLYIKRFRGLHTSRNLSAHAFWELTCILDGPGQIICKKPIILHKYTVCLIPPGTSHCEQSPEGMDIIWVGLEGAMMKSVPRDGILPVHNKIICDLAEQMWLLAEHEKGIIGPELDGLLRVITGMFFRAAFDGDIGQGHDCIERAIRFFNAHFAESLSIPETAKCFGCSEGYFQHIFRQRTGTSPVAYLTKVRCRHAAHLLEETNWPVRRIAELSGYADQLYFSRVFRRIYGLCPNDFRGRASDPRQPARRPS